MHVSPNRRPTWPAKWAHHLGDLSLTRKTTQGLDGSTLSRSASSKRGSCSTRRPTCAEQPCVELGPARPLGAARSPFTLYSRPFGAGPVDTGALTATPMRIAPIASVDAAASQAPVKRSSWVTSTRGVRKMHRAWACAWTALKRASGAWTESAGWLVASTVCSEWCSVSESGLSSLHPTSSLATSRARGGCPFQESRSPILEQLLRIAPEAHGPASARRPAMIPHHAPGARRLTTCRDLQEPP